jgi:hypothetical protein
MAEDPFKSTFTGNPKPEPAKVEPAKKAEKATLEERFEMLLKLCVANGWSIPKGLR